MLAIKYVIAKIMALVEQSEPTQIPIMRTHAQNYNCGKDSKGRGSMTFEGSFKY